jgi:hypothetical protein
MCTQTKLYGTVPSWEREGREKLYVQFSSVSGDNLEIQTEDKGFAVTRMLGLLQTRLNIAQENFLTCN